MLIAISVGNTSAGNADRLAVFCDSLNRKILRGRFKQTDARIRALRSSPSPPRVHKPVRAEVGDRSTVTCFGRQRFVHFARLVA